MMNQIIYSTKTAAYQMQLTVIKYQLIKDAARYLKDNIYDCEVSYGLVQDILLSLSILASLRHNPEDQSCWLLLPIRRENASLNNSRRAVACVVSRDTSLLIATRVLKTLTRSPGSRPMKRYLQLHQPQQDPLLPAENWTFKETVF
jgi:hypothetical protein